MVRILLLMLFTLIASSANAQDSERRPADPKAQIERALEVGHCLAYYKAAQAALDPFEKELALMGQEIMDLSLMLSSVDKNLTQAVAETLKNHMQKIPTSQLVGMYDDYCDDVSDRVKG